MSAAEKRDIPDNVSKDNVASELIRWHFRVARGLKEVYRILSEHEYEQGEPIKLLEIDPESPETGRVDAFFFGPDGDITYSSVVALITPNDLKQIRSGRLSLPDGWTLEGAQRFLPGE